jgi:hypothetical protein
MPIFSGSSHKPTSSSRRWWSRLGELLARAKDILRGEGPVTLLRRVLDFYIFHRDNYYLYMEDLHLYRQMNEADYLPRIEGFTFKVVRSNEEADQLAKAMGHDFRKLFVNAGKRLDRGATAFCTFVEGETANVGWLAPTERAKRTLFDMPLRVDFSNSECYLGGSEALPEYKGKGLMTYNSFRMYRFRGENGIRTARYAMSMSNHAARWQAAKFEPVIYAKARFIRFLWWKYWKETSLAPPGGSTGSGRVPESYAECCDLE